jgi:peptidoglycan/xylan/chitin deacetylase (PgdA/CDA1 family)
MRFRRRLGELIALVALLGAGAAVASVVSSSGNRKSRNGASHAGVDRRTHGHRTPRRVHGPHDKPVPILMYHVISDPLPGAPYPELYTPRATFTVQMRALHRRGYHAVTLAQVDRYWHKAYALPRRPIVLSFDDGYLSDYTHARPVLRRFGWPGVLNLEVNNVLTRGDLSARHVRALVADGWEVDSHTVSHPDLTTLPPARLRTELVKSRSWLRRRFHVPVDYFCYPSGRYDRTVMAAVKAAGYRLATTTQPGLARPNAAFALDRIRVDGTDGVRGLLGKLARPQTGQSSSPVG